MKQIGNYCLGTMSEIAELIYTRWKDKKKFCDCDFAPVFPNIPEGLKPEDAWRDYCDGYYGIKRIVTGFDLMEGEDLFADYYSGGQGFTSNVSLNDGKESCIAAIKHLMLNTLSVPTFPEAFDESQMLLAHFLEKKEKETAAEAENNK